MKKTNRNRKHLSRKMGSVEQLESRFMQSANWRNPADNLDVNADGNVSPIDALVVINYLNRGNSSTLPLLRPEDSPFVDIDANGSVEPIDALRVINYLNRVGNNPNLLEGNNSSIDVYRDIEVATGLEGSRAQLYRLQIDAQLDSPRDSRISPDIFSVYLLDPSNPSATLLNRSQQGTSIFTLYPDGRTELAAGLVRWDGNILEVDLSGIETRGRAILRAQLLQSRPNSGSIVKLRPLSNEVSEELVPGSLISAASLALPALPTQNKTLSKKFLEDYCRSVKIVRNQHFPTFSWIRRSVGRKENLLDQRFVNRLPSKTIYGIRPVNDYRNSFRFGFPIISTSELPLKPPH